MEVSGEHHIPVIIIGGGPIGLFLGICLSKLGIAFRIFEKRVEINPHSRSIGIHPPSLGLFADTDILTPFLKNGLKIEYGKAFVNRDHVGTVPFRNLPCSHTFILSLPQYRTEQLLERELSKLGLELLSRDARLQSLDVGSKQIRAHVEEDGSTQTYTCDFLIGCDGKNSKVRTQAQIPFPGHAYSDTYIMGDFDDTTTFGTKAAVFLHQRGVVESFPLPKKRRRWVIKTKEYDDKPTRNTIATHLKERLDMDIADAKSYMISSFGVQHHMAEQFVKDRIILAGDAAHVVSPIGGQGMNLGWQDAWKLSQSLDLIYNRQHPVKTTLETYQQTQQQITRKVARRAEWNMKLGRSFHNAFVRKSLLTLLIKTPVSNLLTRLFAMQHLDDWPV